EAACNDVAGQVTELAASLLGGQASEFSLIDGGVIGRGETLSFRELLRRLNGIDSGEFVGIGRITPRSKSGGFGLAPPFWETAAGVFDIELDEDTGAIKVKRAVGAADVGKVLNRK